MSAADAVTEEVQAELDAPIAKAFADMLAVAERVGVLPTCCEEHRRPAAARFLMQAVYNAAVEFANGDPGPLMVGIAETLGVIAAQQDDPRDVVIAVASAATRHAERIRADGGVKAGRPVRGKMN